MHLNTNAENNLPNVVNEWLTTYCNSVNPSKDSQIDGNL